MPKISFIVPVYNSAKYLKECIDSILAQSLSDLELIAINDGSSDNSYEILQSYTDERLKIINKQNAGASAARNDGILVASAEYILCIDSDDFIDKDYAKDCYEIAKKYNADIVITDILYFGEINKYQHDFTAKSEIIDQKEYFKALVCSSKAMPSSVNKMIKTKIFKNNLFPTNIFLGEDLSTMAGVVNDAKKIVKINKAYYHYRIGSNNDSEKKTLQNTKDIKNSINNLIKLCQNNSRTDLLPALELRKIKNVYLPIIYSKADINNIYFIKALQLLRNDLKDIMLSKGFKKLRFKYKIIFYLINRIQNNQKLSKIINIFNKINNLFSKRKIKEFVA